MAASALGLGLFLAAADAPAQNYPGQPAWDRDAPAAPPSVGTLEFHRDAVLPEIGNSHEIAPEVMPAHAQPPGGQKLDKGPAKGYDVMEFRSLREVPGLEVVSRLESEAALYERMRQEVRKSGDTIVFPDEPPLTKEVYQGRQALELTKMVEPAFVCHPRLLFEQKNFERGLWDFGLLGPVLSNVNFAYDLVMLPYHLATRPFQQYECSAGKCLPGDPTPFYLYPEEFSVSGLTAEAAAMVGLFFVFP
jgi:hypothetical protein